MLAPQQLWCPRCKRYVDTKQKQNKVGRHGKLVKIVTTCGRCRTTLSSKTTSTQVVEQIQAKAVAEQMPSDSERQETEKNGDET